MKNSATYNIDFKKYATDVLSGKEVAGLYIKQACKRYLSMMEDERYDFREDMAMKPIKFIGMLKHYTGRFSGKPFVLSDWQIWIVASVFGFYYHGTNERVTKNVYVEVARKNGKTAFTSALALYALCDGSGAEVEFAANSAKQACIDFDMAKNFLQSIDAKGKYFKYYRDKIKFPSTKSFLQIISSDKRSNDGWNSSFFVVDEYHAATDNASSSYSLLKSSQGMRDNPLAVVITTAGLSLFCPCYEMRQSCIEVLSGVKKDETQFSAIYALDEGDDYRNEKVWKKANPNLGVTVKEGYLREQVIQAENNVSLETGIKTKNFNLWCNTVETWIANDYILKCTEKLSLDDFSEKVVYMGIDLSSVSDITAVSLMMELDEKFYFKSWYFVPERALVEGQNTAAYNEWYKNGYLNVTSGNVIDYDFILDKMMEINSKTYLQQIAYDSWNSTQLAVNATSNGLPMKAFSQSLGSFNRPTKQIEILIRSGKAVIDDNPITRWMFSNVVLRSDYCENVKPTKSSSNASSAGKIDGVISMTEALGVYLMETHYDNSIMTV